MTDRDSADESPRPPKRRMIDDRPSQNKLPASIMLSNPHVPPDSSSGKMLISKFPQELSVFTNGTDIRIKLPETEQADEVERPIRLIFHNPLLSLPYHESYFQSTPPVYVGHEHQKPSSPAPEALSNSPQGSPASQKYDCEDFLDNVRITPDESRLLHTMLGI